MYLYSVTYTALLTITYNNQIDCLYLDFKKAFDSVSHKLLVYKLKMYNISESIISWIESFVHNRKQAVQNQNGLVK